MEVSLVIDGETKIGIEIELYGHFYHVGNDEDVQILKVGKFPCKGCSDGKTLQFKRKQLFVQSV